MTKPIRWTAETIFAPLLGFAMAAFLASACYVGQNRPTSGSQLVPAATLAKLIENGRVCQTITDEEVFLHFPRRC